MLDRGEPVTVLDVRRAEDLAGVGRPDLEANPEEARLESNAQYLRE